MDYQDGAAGKLCLFQADDVDVMGGLDFVFGSTCAVDLGSCQCVAFETEREGALGQMFAPEREKAGQWLYVCW
uniref:Uncharacterized protein n=1 Tax=Aegilops tauschii subsp. strangulata TaxID=200361 RepID=A0A452Y1C1_AEGTS